MSDSHGWSEEVKSVVERHQHETKAIIHCGDSELTKDAAALKGVKTVKGNCDFGSDFPEDILEVYENVRVYATHGHLYNVKMTSTPLSYRAEEVGADIVCFGHSHMATSFMEQGSIFINPGSLRLPRSPKEQTYVLCDVTDTEIDVRFYERETGKEITELAKTYQRAL